MQKLFDTIIEIVCWLCIAITLWIVIDVERAEIRYNKTVQNIPPLVERAR